VRRVWAATIDFTPDHLPIHHPHTDYASRAATPAGCAVRL